MKNIIISVTNDLISDQRVHKIATSLSGSGYNVTLTGRVLVKNQPKLNRRYKTKRFRLFFKKGVLFYAEYNLRLFIYLLFSDFDIYLSNDLDTLPSNFIASRIRRKTLVYDSHELFTEVPELVNRKLTRKIWELIEKIFLPGVKFSYTVCDSLASIYKEKYGISMSVVRNVPVCNDKAGVESGLSILDTKSTKKIILYQGSVNIGRGIDLVIRSMKFLEGYEFHIVGSGDVIEEMKTLAKTEGVESRVRFTGRVPFESLSEITKYASLGISLEENMGLNYYYSLPNKIFDYIQSEIPVLVSPFPEMTNVIDIWNVGMVAETRDPQELAKQIEFMLTDETSRLEWKNNLKKAAKELCWENEEKVLLKIFDSIKS